MADKIAAICGHRYEPEWLVDDWKENHKWFDELLVLDDRDRDPAEKWDNEAVRYRKYREMALGAGVQWLYVTAPDERLGSQAEQVFRRGMENGARIYYSLRVLELYTPTQYRIDGHWARHRHARMYRLQPYQKIYDSVLHANPVPMLPRLFPKKLPTDIYHLKHIEKENRRIRTELFNELDPKAKLGGLRGGTDYNYLDDEEGLKLEKIPKENMYSPPYRKPYLFNP